MNGETGREGPLPEAALHSDDDPFDELAPTSRPGAAAAPASPALIRRRQPRMPSGPPLYRVVEVTVDADGRPRRQGQIWHPDLDRTRRFGRALAANTAAAKVMVADSRGDVLETLEVAGEGDRHACWNGWRDIPLPPPPPRPRAAPALRRMSAPVLTDPLALADDPVVPEITLELP